MILVQIYSLIPGWFTVQLLNLLKVKTKLLHTFREGAKVLQVICEISNELETIRLIFPSLKFTDMDSLLTGSCK